MKTKIGSFLLAFITLLVATTSLVFTQQAHAVPFVPENIVAKYGSAKFSSGTVGVVGQTFPTGIFNASNFTSGVTYRGADVNVDTSAYDCWTAWNFFQVMCDPGAGANSQTKLTPGVSNAGSTFTIGNLSNPATQIGYIVIDLGSVRSFDTFQVYQMFADGKVTWASLSTTTNQTDTWPTYENGAWQNVVQGNVPAGSSANNEITGPASFSFSTVSSRYVLMEFKNDASHGNSYYIEVPSVKLFWNSQPAPTPEPTPTLADTGITNTGLFWATALLVTGVTTIGATRFLQVRRQLRKL